MRKRWTRGGGLAKFGGETVAEEEERSKEQVKQCKSRRERRIINEPGGLCLEDKRRAEILSTRKPVPLAEQNRGLV